MNTIVGQLKLFEEKKIQSYHCSRMRSSIDAYIIKVTEILNRIHRGFCLFKLSGLLRIEQQKEKKNIVREPGGSCVSSGAYTHHRPIHVLLTLHALCLSFTFTQLTNDGGWCVCFIVSGLEFGIHSLPTIVYVSSLDSPNVRAMRIKYHALLNCQAPKVRVNRRSGSSFRAPFSFLRKS